MRLFGFFILICLLSKSHSQGLIKHINISGNKTTKDLIIERELPFKLGDQIEGKIDSLKHLALQNLNNTNLFNSIEVEFEKEAQNYIVNVVLQERWYIWPSPKFEIIERNAVTWWNNGRNLERANYGLFLNHNNFRGRREILKIKFKIGYVQTIGFDYDNPFLNKKGKWGLRTSYHFLTRNEVPVTAENAKWVFYKNEDDIIRTEHQSFIQLYYRPEFFLQHKMVLNHRHTNVDSTIENYYPIYLNNQSNTLNYFSLKYELKWDRRNDKDFPTKGSYFECSIHQIGLGILDKSLDNLLFVSEWKDFYQMNSKLFFAYGGRVSLSSRNEISTYVEPVLGRREVPRGYDAYLLHGQTYGVLRTNLRYQIFNKNQITIPGIPKKFNKIPLQSFIGVFGDIGYVDDIMNYRNDGLNNQYLYSAGFGLESISFYDLVFRLEYSMNHLLESGLFIHFTAPI